ncbi:MULTISPECIES: phage integrase family protein [Cupriavidus]|uniref:Phage integrase n=3 Tax=Cupriavidus TaxID=106589 RepID=A0A375DSS2_9BURK|nr:MULTISPECIES: phage integrase family protein [Cupriavidus]MCO4865847.1 site-specific integrase [Cupriavidus sp. WGlv3]MCO4893519.1 site-specific integrase [Cupriavidus sp. WGtm5]ULX56178.1 integrase [Cupriavidus taiwanensis]CAP63968.1 Phage integrase [Cupriavidus taiwanensis LMG 19424]SOY74553.1 Phage integrase [Cupriavidus taiwanensis]
MAQHNLVAADTPRYTRADFTALRFRLNRIPTEQILARVYDEEALHAAGIDTAAQLEARLDAMRDHLVERVCLSNPYLSASLADARRFNSWPKSAIDYLVRAADQDFSAPQPDDPVSAWLRPIVFRALRHEHIQTLGQLHAYIALRGRRWYLPVPRLGAGKARAIERWLQSQAATLGPLAVVDDTPQAALVELGPDLARKLVPLEQMGRVVAMFDGSEGRNRAPGSCLIAARNDLEAIQAYLYRFRDRNKTARAYQKELERFLLWCVGVRRIALSSVGVDDCERYKDFLAQPDPSWVGPKAPRSSARWRPFAGALKPESQRYAVLVLRGFFAWLVGVRYLGGNPWLLVPDPLTARREVPIAVEKALPGQLWTALVQPGGILDQLCAKWPAVPVTAPLTAKDADAPGAQYRLARAAVLLLGCSGARREEAAGAQRCHLQPVPEQAGIPAGLWELALLGKRSKWRTVFLPARAIDALRAHWADRGHDFENADQALALLSPVVVPSTRTAQAKHLSLTDGESVLTGKGFSPDGLYQLLTATLQRIADDASLPMTEPERDLLRRAAPHALRHTFATHAVANEMPADVLQRLLGHASLQTTSLYVRAERARGLAAVSKLFPS